MAVQLATQLAAQLAAQLLAHFCVDGCTDQSKSGGIARSGKNRIDSSTTSCSGCASHCKPPCTATRIAACSLLAAELVKQLAHSHHAAGTAASSACSRAFVCEAN